MLVVQHAWQALWTHWAAVLPGQVVEELHLEGLEVVACVLVLGHLLLIHRILPHHIPLLPTVEDPLQILRQLHLTVQLTQLLLCRLRPSNSWHLLVSADVVPGVRARACIALCPAILLCKYLLTEHLHKTRLDRLHLYFLRRVYLLLVLQHRV